MCRWINSISRYAKGLSPGHMLKDAFNFNGIFEHTEIYTKEIVRTLPNKQSKVFSGTKEMKYWSAKVKMLSRDSLMFWLARYFIF